MPDAIFNQIIRECARFSKKEIAPMALEADLNRDTAFAQTVWRKSAELDIPSLLIPEAFGGIGYATAELTIEYEIPRRCKKRRAVRIQAKYRFGAKRSDWGLVRLQCKVHDLDW